MDRPDAARRAALLLIPPLLLGSMLAAFRGFARLLGPRQGYLAGFLIYWLGWCLALPLWVLGPRRLRARFAPTPHARRDLALLAVPPVLGLGAMLPASLRDASAGVVAASAAIAAVNGALEEALWRATYHAAFPDDRLRGLLYPALGFAVWHYAPQVIFPNRRPGGATSLVAVSGALGLLWGGVARRTGSSLGTTVSHALFDFSGLGARIYRRGG